MLQCTGYFNKLIIQMGYPGNISRKEVISQRSQIKKTKFVEKRLNTRPKKCLDMRIPEMVFFELSDVALVT